MTRGRLYLVRTVIFNASAACAAAAFAQDYPIKPIRIVTADMGRTGTVIKDAGLRAELTP